MSEKSEALNKAYAAFQQAQTDINGLTRLKEELLNLAEGAIYSVFQQAAGNVLAEEIVLEILQALPAYCGRNNATFSTWAFGIAKRKAIDALREMKGGRRRSESLGAAAKKRFEMPPPEELAVLYASINSSSVDVTEKERLFVRRILGKGLPHPLSPADRQRLSRLCKKLGLRDVTRMENNK